MKATVFPLAEMSPLIKAFTALILSLPIFFVFADDVFMHATALALVLLYASVWVFMRPSRFEVNPTHLTLVFPGRSSKVRAKNIQSVEVYDRKELEAKVGTAARIGVGGLWGGFGWLWTSKLGILTFFVSRLDGYVFIERAHDRPLLLTPSDPEAFADALRDVI